MAKLFGSTQCLNRLSILDGSRLLDVQRLLVIGQLAFKFIHFQLGGFRTGFIFILTIGSFCHDFILFFKANLQLFKIRFVAFNLFLLAQRSLHQIEVIACRLIIGFKIAFRTVMLTQLARHIHVLILLSRQLLARGVQFTTIFQRFVEMNTTFISVAHIICCHIVSRFADQMLKQVTI